MIRSTSLLAALASLALAGFTHAAPTVGTAPPPPVVKAPPPTIQQNNTGLHVSKFRVVPPPSATTPGGMVVTATGPITNALKFEVEVTNNTDAVVNTNLTVTRPAPGIPGGTADEPKWEFPVALAARKSMTVTFTDPKGVLSGCNPFDYAFKFQSASEKKLRKVFPNCSFETSTVGAPTSTQTTNTVYYEGARLKSTPKCNEKFDVAAYARNSGTANESYDVLLSIHFPGNTPPAGPGGIQLGPNTNKYGRSKVERISYPGGSGSTKVALFTTEGDAFTGAEGDYVLKVARSLPSPTGSNPLDVLVDKINGTDRPRTPIADPTWSIRVKRTTCSPVVSPF